MKTISEEYRKEQQLLHENPAYGVASTKFAPVVADIIKQTSPKTLTDYCAAKPAGLVCCIDVLEHIEPKLLDNVLKELARITNGLGFFTIHMGPAGKVLSDGRNAHLIQKPTSWWLPKLCNYFKINNMQLHKVFGKRFMVIVSPKKT